jgi:hypothetical protein
MIMDLIYYCCYRLKPPEERLIDRFEELADHEIEWILQKYNYVRKSCC